MIVARRIRVTGVVQGVGFRPFVWRLARALDVVGWVRNDSFGVEIAVEGSEARLRALRERIEREAPPLARIHEIQELVEAPQGLTDFRIAGSVTSRCATAIGPDTAVCGDCLAELFDPADRRWRHPFITCTQCGPRYTIARSLPYDRSRTSMSSFALCTNCEREYADVQNRRFHAEPIACPHCGPRVRLLDAAAATIEGDPIARTLEIVTLGGIVAMKGLGGYHLICDARNAPAVTTLRRRKDREAKPLAIMAAGVSSLHDYVELDAPACELLCAPERPIVLVPKRAGADNALEGIAPGMATLGVMLPCTPLQYLLFHESAGRPAGKQWLDVPQPLLLVMTSANPRGEPLVIDDAEARERLAGIADAWLQHDREIVGRCDDSVVIADRQPCFVRRARGYMPEAIRLQSSGPTVLAVGAHLKNTVCVTRGNEAFVSQHVGDLDDAATSAFFEESIERLLTLLEVEPAIVAHDLHPDMVSTRYATSLATARGLRVIGVQHHHAHVAAVLAEHAVDEPVLGLALDGIGLGPDGGAWGGELLVVDGATMRRVGHLAELPLPGGDRAAREPWRMAAAALHCLGRSEEIGPRFPQHAAAQQLPKIIKQQLNCPPTSSMGRLFDAAAALLGIAEVAQFEAEAAMRLEACARGVRVERVARAWDLDRRGVLNVLPLLARLADWSGDIAEAAALFHTALAQAVIEWTLSVSERERISLVALSGGCFLNRLLHTQVADSLSRAGLRVLSPIRIPPNDAAISLGQAWVALRSMEV